VGKCIDTSFTNEQAAKHRAHCADAIADARCYHKTANANFKHLLAQILSFRDH